MRRREMLHDDEREAGVRRKGPEELPVRLETAGGANTDFLEPYFSIAHTFGPATVKATVNYAPSQSALTIGAGDEDNLYLAGDLAVAIPDSPVTLTAHLGHSFGPSYLTIGDGYTDWSLGATVFAAQDEASLRTALESARRAPGTCLIYVPVTPGSVMQGFSWWDVPPAEVSGIPSVQAARASYEQALKKQRFHY